jgi:lysophospholipase L1-like esterase
MFADKTGSAPQPSAKQRSPLLLSLALAVAFLLLLELACFLVLRYKGIERVQQESNFQYYDGLCGWRYVTPHGFKWEDFSERYDTSTLIVLDRFGFNTTAQNLTLKKQPGELRIIVTGASATFGIGNQRPEWTMPSRLQQELRRRHPGRRINVINACVRGYNTFQQMMFYILYLRGFQPDAVIAVSGPNDITVPSRQGPLGISQPLKNKYQIEMEDFVNQHIRKQIPPDLRADVNYYFSRTNTGRVIQLLLSRFGSEQWLSQLITEQHRKIAPSPAAPQKLDKDHLRLRGENYLKVVKDYGAVAGNAGSGFIALLRPVLSMGKPPTPRERRFLATPQGEPTLQTRQRRFYYAYLRGRMAGVPGLHDFSHIFQNAGSETLYVDASHYNPQGASLFALALADLLDSQDWFQAKLRGLPAQAR